MSKTRKSKSTIIPRWKICWLKTELFISPVMWLSVMYVTQIRLQKEQLYIPHKRKAAAGKILGKSQCPQFPSPTPAAVQFLTHP